VFVRREPQLSAITEGVLWTILGLKHVKFLPVPIRDGLCFHRLAPLLFG